ncbi:hypothetical protein F751_1153 [Auxenochlorella protothecoides]|uniref:Uncharacterized protein n=1 Tax=Auxenochlorella protothecoides TaxID=3075 RepID=A0A087SMR3_AUXPR|nr:hypothetical protein F751_1153 [Auxenochlorella protothecoides]KFM27017.1 hypothetical protein F751_1153 [Auxenochlorella protothecoides]
MDRSWCPGLDPGMCSPRCHRWHGLLPRLRAQPGLGSGRSGGFFVSRRAMKGVAGGVLGVSCTWRLSTSSNLGPCI